MRIKELTIPSGGAADDDAFALEQALVTYTEDQDGIAEAQQAAEDTPLSLEPAAAALNPPRPLTFTSAQDFSGVNFEIVGTDENGDPQTVAALPGPNATTIQTTELWSSVTSITPDDTLAQNIEVGWPDSQNAPAALVLTAGAAAIDPPREVTLTSGDDLSAINFTITGKDRYGHEISETIAGPNSDTVQTKQIFSSISSIVPDGADTGTVEVGYPERVCSRWFIVGGTRGCDDVPSATVQSIQLPGQTYAGAVVEVTLENFMRIPGEGATPAASPASLDSAGKVANVQGFGLRIVVTGTSGAAKFAIARPGL